MEHYIIDLEYDGQPLQVTALCREDGHDLVYDLYTGDVLLGTLSPTCGEEPLVYWISNDMPAGLVKLIGEEIERQDW